MKVDLGGYLTFKCVCGHRREHHRPEDKDRLSPCRYCGCSFYQSA